RTEDRAEAITLTAMTNAGVIIGTPAYMSPEQVRNEAVDHRADIWAFGCVLWELLQGRPPFHAVSFAEIIAAVLTSEPDWKALPGQIPAQVRDLLRHCLRKDVRHRLQDIQEVRIEVEGALRTPIIGTALTRNRIVDSLAV